MKKGCNILDNNRWPQGSQVNFTIYLGATGTTMVQELVPHGTGTTFWKRQPPESKVDLKNEVM
jgi:hypothetical protein